MVREARTYVAAAACAFALFAPTVSHASCFDGIRNGPESDVDCGGDCPLCARGQACRVARDCYSGRCGAYVCEERPYLDGDPVPAGYEVEHSDTDSAAITRRIGIIAFGVSYGAAYATALGLPGEVSWLYAPVVGPWIEIAQSGQGKKGLLAIDGAFQGVGAALLIGGIIGAGNQLIRREDQRDAVSVLVTPVRLGANGYGMGFVGLF